MDKESPKLRSIISPSILSCDFSNLYCECDKLLKAGADWLHIDIMDGHFVPNLTLGPPIIKSLRKKTDAFFDCHCMISEPLKWVKDLADCGANQITFHYEANIDSIEYLASEIRKKGVRAAVALKPGTLVDHTITALLDKNVFDMVLIMTVEPGFGGQSFMEHVLPKVEQLRKAYKDLDIQVDGGVKCENAEKAAAAGANVIVSGTGILDHPDPEYAIKFMRECVVKHL